MARLTARRAPALIRGLLSSRWLEHIGRGEHQTALIIWSGVVGALGAAAASGLRWLGDNLAETVWATSGDLSAAVAAAPPWMRLAVPSAGGLVAGLILVYGVRVTRTATGWDILEAVVLRDGILKFRPALVKSLSSLITIATGGVVGREGPMVLMSATLSSKLGQWLALPTRHLRVLTACGVASGMAAAYNVPIGGALFAMEIILGNFAMEVFAPLVFASVIATLVSRGLYGPEPIFRVPDFELVSPLEIGAYIVLGILGGLMASAFLSSLRLSARFFRKLPLGRPVSMAVVGLVLGAMVLWHPEIVGGGRGLTDSLLDSPTVWRVALILLLLKLLMTSLTVGSGAVGGVFTPALFIGAALGSAFGYGVESLAPWGAAASPSAYALVGMGCLLAGTTHAPIMAILMIFEMSLNYSIVLPLMLSCAMASLVARAVSPSSIYTEALSRKGAMLATPEAQVMTSLTVGEIMRREVESVPPDLPLPQILDRFIKGRRNHLYVTDASGRFVGAVGLHDLKESLNDADDVAFVIALDLIRPSFETTTPEERLDRVMERLWAQDCERIPVLDPETRKLLGTVSKKDIFGVYSLEVLQRKSLMAKFRPADADPDAESTYVELPADYSVDGIEAGAGLQGRTLAEAALRERFGVTVLLVRRAGADGTEVRLVPEPGTLIQAGDRLVVFGPQDGLARLKEL